MNEKDKKKQENYKEFEKKFGKSEIAKLNEKYGFNEEQNFFFSYCQIFFAKFNNIEMIDQYLEYCFKELNLSVKEMMAATVRHNAWIKQFYIMKLEAEHSIVKEYEGDEENKDEIIPKEKNQDDEVLKEVQELKDFIQDLTDIGLDQKIYDNSLKLNGEILKVKNELSNVNEKMNEKREKKATYQQSLDIYERLNDVNASVNETLDKSKDLEKKLPDNINSFSKTDCYRWGLIGFGIGGTIFFLIIILLVKLFLK